MSCIRSGIILCRQRKDIRAGGGLKTVEIQGERMIEIMVVVLTEGRAFEKNAVICINTYLSFNNYNPMNFKSLIVIYFVHAKTSRR